MELGRQSWRLYRKEMKSDVRRQFLTKPYGSRPWKQLWIFFLGPRTPAVVEC